MSYLNVEEIFGQDGRTVIDGNTRAVELAAKHLSADGHSEHVTGELTVRVGVVDFRRTFEDLHSLVSKRAKNRG